MRQQSIDHASSKKFAGALLFLGGLHYGFEVPVMLQIEACRQTSKSSRAASEWYYTKFEQIRDCRLISGRLTTINIHHFAPTLTVVRTHYGPTLQTAKGRFYINPKREV